MKQDPDPERLARYAQRHLAIDGAKLQSPPFTDKDKAEAAKKVCSVIWKQSASGWFGAEGCA